MNALNDLLYNLNSECYSGYKTEEDRKHRGHKTNYLDRVLIYCKEKGITYKEFQRLEYFGKIPVYIITALKDNLAIKGGLKREQN